MPASSRTTACCAHAQPARQQQLPFGIEGQGRHLSARLQQRWDVRHLQADCFFLNSGNHAQTEEDFTAPVKETATSAGKNTLLWKPIWKPGAAVPWSGASPKLSLRVTGIFHSATRCQEHCGPWRWGKRQDGGRGKAVLSSPSPFHCLGSRELWEVEM